MSVRHNAVFHLPDQMLESAKVGEHNFLRLMTEVLTDAGMSSTFVSEDRPGSVSSEFTIHHMRDPVSERGVTIRRAYYYPFWQIEATNERWQWDLAKARFDPAQVDRDQAEAFYKFWQKRLYGPLLASIRQDGFIYVPLQGHLTRCRSFQSASPLEMLRVTLEFASGRPVVAGLHPGEAYSDAEISALDTLEQVFPNLSVQMGGMEVLLPRCDMVVTQNSSVGFAGFFFGKPCVTFGRIDFHHITVPVFDLGVPEAFRVAQQMTPDYAGYVWWFLQHMSINAGRPDAREKIAARLRRFGWPV